MKNALKVWTGFALMCAILCMASMTALARSGGGGNDPGTTAPPLVFDYMAAFNGVAPGWSGDSTVTNSIPGYYSFATLSLNMKAKSVNLPNNTVLQVTAYMTNLTTGQALPPVAVQNMVVLSKSVALKSKTTITNFTYDTIVRRLDQVVVTAADGTVVATCHP